MGQHRTIIGVGHTFVGRSSHTNRAHWHDNIAIAWLLAAIDHAIDQAMIKGHHHAFARHNINGDSSHGGNAASPCSSRIDHIAAGEIKFLAS